MALSAYWWSPARSPRSIVGETVKHARAWSNLVRHGPASISNFGDAVNTTIIAELTGRRPAWAPIAAADLVCIGSVLNSYVAAGSSAQVLGSGVRRPESSALFDRIPSERVLGVRGADSAGALGLPPDRAIGDPGLVIRSLVARRPRRSGVVVLPHFSVVQDRAGRNQVDALRREFRVVLPNVEPLAVAVAIASSELVLTSSLHAMVFSDALGVPTQLVDFGGRAGREPDFKYSDYESMLGVRSTVRPVSQTADLAAAKSTIDLLEERTSRVADVVDHLVEGIYAAAEPLR